MVVLYRSRWLRVPVLACAIVVTACGGASLPAATVTGDLRPEEPGEYVFESLCASCHGDQGAGALAPALAGHTVDQVLRQVRAPVGEMPMFPAERLTEFGLADVASYVAGMPEADAEHGGHEHAEGLSKQEASEIVHILLARAIRDEDLEMAEHYAVDVQSSLAGNHLDAMIEISTRLGEEDLAAAFERVESMLVSSSATTHVSDDALITRLAHSAAMNGDLAGVEHWLGHLHSIDGLGIDVHALESALAEGDSPLLAELLVGSSADADDHDGDVADAHGHEDAEATPTHDHASEEPEEEAHDNEDGHHDAGVEEPAPADESQPEPDVADHDDAGAEPHDH